MAITILAADVKRKAMIADSDTTYDSSISSLISEMQGPLEFSIADCYLSDITNTSLQATLRLGILEIITGEFIEQIRRQRGVVEMFSAAGVSVGEWTQRGVDLIQQGATRLAPFLKGMLPNMSDSVSQNSTLNNEPIFSISEEIP